MRSLAWLSVLVLVAVVLATGFSWWFSSPERQYLFDGEKGISRPWVADWWTVKIPVAFALGVVASGALIALLRAARSREWGDLVASVAVAALGVSMLAGSLHFVREQGPTTPVECVRPTPQHPGDVFLTRQWRALALMPDARKIGKFEHRFGGFVGGDFGIQDHPGIIPFDPFILDRLTFVGLTYEEVEGLLGPPDPNVSSESMISYSMIGFYPILQVARLYLSFGTQWDRSDVVKVERLRFGNLRGH